MTGGAHQVDAGAPYAIGTAFGVAVQVMDLKGAGSRLPRAARRTVLGRTHGKRSPAVVGLSGALEFGDEHWLT